MARLTAAGQMLPAGLAAIEDAKRSGTWTLLDDVEDLIVPDDLGAALGLTRPPGHSPRSALVVRHAGGTGSMVAWAVDRLEGAEIGITHESSTSVRLLKVILARVRRAKAGTNDTPMAVMPTPMPSAPLARTRW